MSEEIGKLDENMVIKGAEAGLVWRDVREGGVEGRAWDDTERYYCRLPGRAKATAPEAVWELGQDSAGMCARFETDATSISARWTLLNERLALPHMPATGASGIDLYASDKGNQWRWVGVGVADSWPKVEVELVAGLRPGKRMYMLYLPLFNGVESVEIGVEAGAKFRAMPPRTEGTVVIWGTSIVHGGCASRPGMAYPAILGRRLDRPMVNLGFSGNGKMDPEITELLTELRPAVYVIDCVPNMTAPEVAARTGPLVQTLRAVHAEIPIVLVGGRSSEPHAFCPDMGRDMIEKQQALTDAYAALIDSGVTDLHYVPGETLLKDGGEGMVDGSHPTDMGFVQMADALEPVLRPLLGL